MPFKIKATVPAFLRQSGEKMRGGVARGARWGLKGDGRGDHLNVFVGL